MERRCDPRVERTRSRTLDAAVQILGEEGVDGATVDRVAECAGVHKTTIYRHWPQREELLVEALTRSMAPPDPPDSGDVRDDLTTMMRGFARTLSTPPWSVVLPSLVAAAVHNPELARLHTEFVRQRRAVVATVVRRGVERGQLPPDTDVELTVDLLGGPLLYRALMTREPADERYLGRLVGVVLGRAEASGAG